MVFASLCLYLSMGLGRPRVAAEFKGVEYTIPANWKTDTSTGGLILTAKDAPEDKLLAIIILPAIPKGEASWPDVMKNFVNSSTNGMTVVSPGEVKASKRNGFDAFVQSQGLKDPKAGEFNCLFQLIASPTSAAACSLFTNDDALLSKYEKDVGEIMLSIHPKASAEPTTKSSKIRTGDTPNLYPGSNGWLPSGRGTEIPKARLVDGKPTGMWMNPGFDLNSQSVIFATIFLPDGTMIRHPRFGGGNLIDIEGQKQNPNDAKNVGRWHIADGSMTTDIGGGSATYKYSTGKDAEGEFFMFGVAKYRPCIPVTSDYLVGNWHIKGAGEYDFAKDGTVKYSFSYQPNDAGKSTAKWILDGYLFSIDQPNLYIVNSIYRFGTDSIVIDQHIYSRVK